MWPNSFRTLDLGLVDPDSDPLVRSRSLGGGCICYAKIEREKGRS